MAAVRAEAVGVDVEAAAEVVEAAAEVVEVAAEVVEVAAEAVVVAVVAAEAAVEVVIKFRRRSLLRVQTTDLSLATEVSKPSLKPWSPSLSSMWKSSSTRPWGVTCLRVIRYL